MKIGSVLGDNQSEREARLAVYNKPDPGARALWNKAMGLLSVNDRADLNLACEYAQSIKYSHAGLTSEAYFAHPLRVSSLSLLLEETPTLETGIVGILHNVLEVSSIPESELANRFGQKVSDQIADLTVDRSMQWDEDYKIAYYEKLRVGRRSARVVKICDKLDNLFLLCLNPDSSVREKYLWEITTFLIPMVRETMPYLEGYFVDLVRDCEATGNIDVIANN